MTRSVIPDGSRLSKHEPDPERMTEGPFGRLLKDANREFIGEVDQRAAFQRVAERLSTSRPLWPQRAYWLVPATLLVLAGLVTLPTVAAFVRSTRSAATPSLVAEDLRGFRAKAVTVASAATAPQPLAEQTMTPRVESNRASRAKLNAQGTSTAASTGSDDQPRSRGASESLEAQSPPVPERDVVGQPPPTSATASDTGTAPDCLSLARRGQTRDAEACFLKRAEGSGLGAEMALYEVARLRRDVLADAPGALAALAEYRARFPAGSLRREADMSQLELLLQLGRSGEALKQSDELLSSSSSGERAAELHLLRGHILRKAQSRFADAEHEYQLAEGAGARGGEVSYFRALCLEALGRTPEAIALFAQYLEQPQRPYAEDARRRLQRLSP